MDPETFVQSTRHHCHEKKKRVQEWQAVICLSRAKRDITKNVTNKNSMQVLQIKYTIYNLINADVNGRHLLLKSNYNTYSKSVTSVQEKNVNIT